MTFAHWPTVTPSGPSPLGTYCRAAFVATATTGRRAGQGDGGAGAGDNGVGDGVDRRSRWAIVIGGVISFLVVLMALVLPGPACAADPPPLDQVQRTDGVLVVPDHFLRRWDPVTVFFTTNTGPSKAAPEDHPETFRDARSSAAWRLALARPSGYCSSGPQSPGPRCAVSPSLPVAAVPRWCRCCPSRCRPRPRTNPRASPISTPSP